MCKELTYIFNTQKNAQLLEQRGVGFEDVILCIKKHKVLDIVPHHNPKKYPGQWIMVVDMNTETTPLFVAPEGWGKHGVEYGTWCKCSKCGFVARSTITFDFYAEEGEPLVCENCQFHRSIPAETVREIQDKAMETPNEIYLS